METFKGKIRRIFDNGKRVHVARSSSIGEVANNIPDLKIGDKVEFNLLTTIRKIKPKEFQTIGTQNNNMNEKEIKEEELEEVEEPEVEIEEPKGLDLDSIADFLSKR